MIRTLAERSPCGHFADAKCPNVHSEHLSARADARLAGMTRLTNMINDNKHTLFTQQRYTQTD